MKNWPSQRLKRAVYAPLMFASMAAAAVLLAAGAGGRTVQAYDASSTSYFLRGSTGQVSGGGTSTHSVSASYRITAMAGGTVLGTSSSQSFDLSSGFMRNLYEGPAPSYEQVHYHWRKDDGSESSASSDTGGAEDTAVGSVSAGSIKRLRLEIANRGGSIAGYKPQKFGLQYAVKQTSCAATSPSSWNNVGSVGTTGSDWAMAASVNLTDGANTTNVAVPAGGTTDANKYFIAANGGVVNNTSTTTSAVYVPSDSFVELEFAITPTAAASAGSSYCFRADNASSTSYFSYAKYPEASIQDSSLTFVMDSASEALPSITPGTLVATTSILTVGTSNPSGFNVTVSRSNGSATMLLNADSAVAIPDKIAWAPGANCSIAGNATASTTDPNTLEFRVRSAGTDAGNYCPAWWGTDDTTASARFAGFPASGQQIINRASASTPSTQAVVLYNLNVPLTQRTGAYSGSITYTVTTNL